LVLLGWVKVCDIAPMLTEHTPNHKGACGEIDFWRVLGLSGLTSLEVSFFRVSKNKRTGRFRNLQKQNLYKRYGSAICLGRNRLILMATPQRPLQEDAKASSALATYGTPDQLGPPAASWGRNSFTSVEQPSIPQPAFLPGSSGQETDLETDPPSPPAASSVRPANTTSLSHSFREEIGVVPTSLVRLRGELVHVVPSRISDAPSGLQVAMPQPGPWLSTPQRTNPVSRIPARGTHTSFLLRWCCRGARLICEVAPKPHTLNPEP
jgi:hypothetical protein